MFLSALRRPAAMILLATLVGCSPAAMPPPPAAPLTPDLPLATARTLAQVPSVVTEPQDLVYAYEERLLRAYTRDWRQDGVALRWNDLAIDALDDFVSSPPCMARMLTMMHIAIHETMRQVRAGGGDTIAQEAAAAFAAAQVLTYGYWQYREVWASLAARDPAVLAADAGTAELRARDVTGRLIGYARTDRAHERDAYVLPPLPGSWYDPQPVEATAGAWRPWVLSSGGAVEVPVPPAVGTPSFEAMLQGVRDAQENLTPTRAKNAVLWSAIVPPVDLNRVAAIELVDRGLPSFEVAEILMWLNIVQADALIVAWKEKYQLRLIRPDQADPSFVPLIEQPEAIALFQSLPITRAVPDFAPQFEAATPRHPTYPSGHSSNSMAAAVYLAYVFPDRAALWYGLANASGLSRIDLGVHYAFNHLGGQVIGQAVADRVIAYIEETGGVYRAPWETPAL